MEVIYGRRSRKSGRILAKRLRDISGPSVNFGYARAGEVNRREAVLKAVNKRRALRLLAENGVPTPRLLTRGELLHTDNDGVLERPLVGRKNQHRGGGGFYLCRTIEDLSRASRKGCTHYMEYIEGGREFRVHVAFGKSIKIAEKIGDGPVKNFKHGAVFMYPQNFNHKKTLRQHAIKAVMSLGLDFGAVDVIYKDRKYYVLEVNTAPSLTSQSDVVERYVEAFKRKYDQD